MTARQANRWAEQRKQGRSFYAVCAGCFHTGRLFAAWCFLQLVTHYHSSVPPWVLAAELITVGLVSVLLEYFRWNYRELQFFLFNKAQACS